MPSPRRILLTNDDGLTSPGLHALVQELERAGGYDLRVVAPEHQQSGVGHCITLKDPLWAQAEPLPGPRGEVPAYKVRGTPADCVKLAITNLFPDFKPELVLSGINFGPNVGLNVFYSGTVAGALEACINEMPALALSLDLPADGIWRFPLAAELSLPLVERILSQGLPPWTILNANLPNRPREQVRGTRLTRHGRSGFKEYYVEEEGAQGRRRFRLEGTMIYRDQDAQIDAVALQEGWISVTPLGLNLEDPRGWEHVARWDLFAREKISGL